MVIMAIQGYLSYLGYLYMMAMHAIYLSYSNISLVERRFWSWYLTSAMALTGERVYAV